MAGGVQVAGQAGPVHHHTEEVKVRRREQIEFRPPIPNTDGLGGELFAPHGHEPVLHVRNAKPHRVGPGGAGLAQLLIGPLDEYLGLGEPQFRDFAAEPARRELVVALIPLGQVAGVFVRVMGPGFPAQGANIGRG